MGDRSYLQAFIYACPPEQENAVTDVLQEMCLTVDSHTQSALQLGEAYTLEECYLDTYDELMTKLIERAPGVSACAWNDPKYEFLGGFSAYTPELGRFDGYCDAEGEVVLTYGQLTCALETGQSIERAYGRPWVERFEELRERITTMGAATPLLEERPEGTYYLGPLGPAKAYLRDCYDVRERVLSDGKAVQVGEYLPGDTEPSSWGTSENGDWNEAWRYFAGADFGPLDDEYDETRLRELLSDFEED